MILNIPKEIVAGDRVTWFERVDGISSVDTVGSYFLRGNSSLDLTGVPDRDGWYFEITEAQSNEVKPGVYFCQFVIYPLSGRKTLGTISITVNPSFESLSELDTRLPEERELIAVSEAIKKLSNGVAEYEIGSRKVRYHDLQQLYQRQTYLRNRIAKIKNPNSLGGRNVGIRFI